MSNIISKDDAYEVSDSTDWLETPLRSVAAIDSALRCQVCKDFYTTPMITSCSHTFCSLCIRRCLSNDGKCPACRGNDQELKLRFNGAMEELVQAFIKARPEVLEYARKPPIAARSSSPKRSRREAGLEEDGGPSKRTTRSSQRSSQMAQSAQLVEVVDLDNDADYVPEAGFVQCPVCGAEVKEEIINAHLDRACQEEPKPKANRTALPTQSNPSSKATQPMQRLPQVNYGLLKDGLLRRKLIDQGLSGSGTRQLMIQRYTEWVTLWNANCDATRPKTKGELRREMEVWERTQGGRTANSNSSHSSGAQIRDKDFDGAAWSTKHDDDFQRLIANARKKAAPKPPDSKAVANHTETGPAQARSRDSTSASNLHNPEIPGTEQNISSPSPGSLPLLNSRNHESSNINNRLLHENIDLPPISTTPDNQSRMSIDKDASVTPDMSAISTIQS